MRLIYLSFIVVLLFSCKKGVSEFTIKGTISDLTMSQGHSGATVFLYEIEAGGGNTSLIGTTNANELGEYSFKFSRNKAESYIISVRKGGYFDIDKTVSFSELSIKEDNVVHLSTTAKSWVKLRFINTNPSPTDHLRYLKQKGKINCEECCSADEQNLIGNSDTTIYCINDGNATYSYNYWVLGTTISGSKSVTTNAFDTTELLLNY